MYGPSEFTDLAVVRALQIYGPGELMGLVSLPALRMYGIFEIKNLMRWQNKRILQVDSSCRFKGFANIRALCIYGPCELTDLEIIIGPNSCATLKYMTACIISNIADRLRD